MINVRNIRLIIYVTTFLVVATVYIYIQNTFKTEELRNIRLSQSYALLSVTYLYFTLLASPLYASFPDFPAKPLYIKARKALGLSAFSFALFHVFISFFRLLGGFEGLKFLSQDYIPPILIGFTSLIVLSILALTSIPTIVKKLGKYWKPLHRIVYLLGISILVHAMMIGTHFSSLSDTIPQAITIALAVLLVLEIIRIEKYVNSKWTFIPHYTASVILSSILLFLYLVYGIPLLQGNHTLSIHSSKKHIASTNVHNTTSVQNIDPDRFNAQFINEVVPEINKPFTAQFAILDTERKANVTTFRTLFEKQLHLILLDSKLEHFQHLHPTLDNDVFSFTTQVSKESKYYLYLNYEPFGFGERHSELHIQTAGGFPEKNTMEPDRSLVKNTDDYEVTLEKRSDFSANKLMSNEQIFKFNILDKKTGQPVKDIQPYLGAFGHVSFINRDTYEFHHLHPKEYIANPDSKGGPAIEFAYMPSQIKITSGIYRLFLEFKHNDSIKLVNYTIEIK